MQGRSPCTSGLATLSSLLVRGGLGAATAHVPPPLGHTHTHTPPHRLKRPSTLPRHIYVHTQTHVHIHTQRNTHRHTCTGTHKGTETQGHTHTETHTGTHSPTPRLPAPSPHSFYLPAPAGQARVPSDLALEVVLALPVPAQVDGAGLHVDVHQVVHDAALDVVLDPVHQEPPAHVDHLDQGQVPAQEGDQRVRTLDSTAGARPRRRPSPTAETQPQPIRSVSSWGHRRNLSSLRVRGSESVIPAEE